MNFTALRLDAAWHCLKRSTACTTTCVGTWVVGTLILLTVISSSAQVITGSTSDPVAAPVSSKISIEPPMQFQAAVRAAALSPPPKGFIWQRIEAMEVAVVIPEDWKSQHKNEPYAKTYAFSGDSLIEKGQFGTGLTVRLLWHPQLAAGNEAKASELVLGAIARNIRDNKAENQVLRGTLDDKAGKKLMIIRYRNAPSGLPPIVVHNMVIADPRSGLVYQFIFESPESQWDESWKIGEQILSRISIFFQKD